MSYIRGKKYDWYDEIMFPKQIIPKEEKSTYGEGVPETITDPLYVDSFIERKTNLIQFAKDCWPSAVG